VNPIWVGQFEISGPRQHPWLDGCAGAFVWIAAQAEDAAKLQLRVTNVLRDNGLSLMSSEEIHEVFDEDALPENLADLIPEARRNVESVVLGSLHLFRNQDA